MQESRVPFMGAIRLSAPNKQSILFVRHAESIANAGFRTTIPADIPLTERGAIQAQLTADIILHIPGLVITSSFLRAKQTAEPLLKRYPGVRCEEWDVHEFTYLNQRRCEGTTYQERKRFVQEYWDRGEPEYKDHPTCECFASFMRRVEAVLSRVKDREEDEIVIFTHGHVIRAIKWLQTYPSRMFDVNDMRTFDALRKDLLVPNCGVLTSHVDEANRLTMISTISSAHLVSGLVTI